MAREMPTQNLTHGGQVQVGNRMTKCQWRCILESFLVSSFCFCFDEEHNLRSLANVYGFHRYPHETTGAVLARFEVVLARVRTRAGFQIQLQRQILFQTGLS